MSQTEVRPAVPVKRGRGDIHVHTTFSDGLSSPQQVLDMAQQQGLDLIAITDHDSVAGALLARELHARGHYDFDLIVGTEVTTARGVHVLALFVEERLPALRSLEHTCEAILRQGGVVIAPHPLSPLTPSMGRRQIERLLATGFPLAAVETLNPSPAGRITRAKLARLNAGWGLAEVGGSDAHFLCRIGTAYTEYDGSTAADFRSSLAAKRTTAGELPLPHPRISLPDYVRQSAKALVVNPLQKVRRRISGTT